MEALGQLIQLPTFTRDFYSNLVVANWDQNRATTIDASDDVIQALKQSLSMRVFDPQHLALAPRDPLALLECYVDGMSKIVQPSARGFALVEAILTGKDVTY